MADTAIHPVKPASRSPELRPQYDEDDQVFGPNDCGWDLAWDCNLSVGHELDDNGLPDMAGPLVVWVAARSGMTKRTVTREQIRAFGLMLVALADEGTD